MNKNMKKLVKYWIMDKVDFVYNGLKNSNHYMFKFEVNHRLTYLFSDKAIDKRIKKWLKKKYNIDSNVYIVECESDGYYPESYNVMVEVIL